MGIVRFIFHVIVWIISRCFWMALGAVLYYLYLNGGLELIC